jgi:hypothetical protein
MSILRMASELELAPAGRPKKMSAPVGAVPAPVKAERRKMWVEWISEPGKWAGYAAAWEKLAAAAIEPNAFYEPWMLLPARSVFGAGKNLGLALVFAPNPACDHGPPRLCGVFPLEIQNRYQGLHRSLPVKTLGLWKHKYCYLCTPLLSAECAGDTLQTFFDWLDSGSHGCALMEFNFIAGDGPFHHLLTDLLHKTAKLTFTSECYTRALFQPASNADAYLRQALSGKHRKALRRQERRLMEIGRLTCDSLDATAAQWIEELMQLEARGWKGRENTALASNRSEQAYFKTIAAEAFRRGQLMMLALRLDGRAIAGKCNFVAGPGSFAFKIAYDETYGRYSPGQLLEVENIRLAHNHPHIEWMDSCADPFHIMIDSIWPARRTIRTVAVSTGQAPGDFIVSVLPLLKWLNRKVRRRRITWSQPTTTRWTGGEK